MEAQKSSTFIGGKRVVSIHVLPKKPGEDGHEEIVCLEEACFRVRVPSDSTYLTMKRSEEKHSSDDSFEAYALRGQQGSEDFEPSSSTLAFDEDDMMRNQSEGGGMSLNYDGDGEGGEGMEEDEGQVEEGSIDDCVNYMGPVHFAKELVKEVVVESEANAETMLQPPGSSGPMEGDADEHRIKFNEFRGSSEDYFVETKRSRIKWPTIGDFSVEYGAFTIDEYLTNFDTEEDWMYVIYYQGSQESPCSESHKYQAIYSLPTWKYPIAQATASIFFTIEVCRAKPAHCPVDVTFVYETFRKANRPGESDFQEQWLHYILDSKIKFFQTITY